MGEYFGFREVVMSDDMLAAMYEGASAIASEDWLINEYLIAKNEGDEVVDLQVRLYKLGYLDKEDIGNSVGTYEEYTAAAVNEVMKVLNFRRRDGSASAEFITILYSDAADVLKKDK